MLGWSVRLSEGQQKVAYWLPTLNLKMTEHTSDQTDEKLERLVDSYQFDQGKPVSIFDDHYCRDSDYLETE